MAIWFTGRFVVCERNGVVYNESRAKNGNMFCLIDVISSSKVKGEDKYEIDFKYERLMFFGELYNKIKAYSLKGGEQIEVKSGKETTSYNKETKRNRHSYMVYDFEVIPKKDKDTTNNVTKPAEENTQAQEEETVPQMQEIPLDALPF